jgi:alkylmercury lyase
MMNAHLDRLIAQLKARHGKSTQENRRLRSQLLRFVARGEPVLPEQVTSALELSLETVNQLFNQMQTQGCEFDVNGNLVGMILTQIPTSHRFRVAGRDLYAWCALDTLFLPALLGQTAEVESACPVTSEKITLTISPDRIEVCSPPEVVISLVTADCCTPGPQGDFCGQIFFFASHDTAAAWIGERSGIEILSAADAFTLAHAVYVDAAMSD